jgi:sulfate adenylyltransferase subunit 1
MSTTLSPLAPERDLQNTEAALTFITCGSVDDGKSTLMGRLLLDSRALLQDQVSRVQRGGTLDLAALTDGLSAEREQGITIDVAWRYFRSARRKFIMGDSPGHEQYTRNMVTAASQASAAVVLIDASKLDWRQAQPTLLPQTRRHSLLLRLLRVPHVVFAVNKLDAVEDARLAFAHISAAVQHFAAQAGWAEVQVIPVSALRGDNVVEAQPSWAGYHGPSLLSHLEQLPHALGDETHPGAEAVDEPAHFSVQWIDKPPLETASHEAHRVLWGRVLRGRVRVGDALRVNDGLVARVAALQRVNHVQLDVATPGFSVGLSLDRPIDVSRGDALQSPDAQTGVQTAQATVAWLDTQALVPGRSYWALHGHRWVKAKVTAIDHQINIHDLSTHAADQLSTNAIGRVRLRFAQALPLCPYAQSRALGRLILVDTASHATAAAVLIDDA